MRALLVVAASIFAESASASNVFQDAWNVVTDPLKLGKGSDNLYRSLLQSQQLEGQINEDVKARLTQFGDVVDKSQQEIFDNATRLEEQINIDVNKTILNAKCAATDILNIQLQNAVAEILARLSDAQLEVKVGSVTLGTLKGRRVSAVDPTELYYVTKKQTIDHLEQTVTEDSDAVIIFDTYQRMVLLAKTIRCSYLNQPLKAQEFSREENTFELLSFPWSDLLHVSH